MKYFDLPYNSKFARLEHVHQCILKVLYISSLRERQCEVRVDEF